ncbi:MAG: hypothetical protein R2713_22500 [Ilumatobacteraceae bacterium]
MGTLRLDLAVRARLARFASYRAATVAGVATNTFFGVFVSAAVVAVARQRGEVSGYAEQDLVTQVWVMAGCSSPSRSGGGPSSANAFVRARWPSTCSVPSTSSAGGRPRPRAAAHHALVRGTAPFVIASLLFTLRLPTDVATVPLFVISVVLAVVVSFGLRYLTNLAAFWIGDVRGVVRLSMAV